MENRWGYRRGDKFLGTSSRVERASSGGARSAELSKALSMSAGIANASVTSVGVAEFRLDTRRVSREKHSIFHALPSLSPLGCGRPSITSPVGGGGLPLGGCLPSIIPWVLLTLEGGLLPLLFRRRLALALPWLLIFPLSPLLWMVVAFPHLLKRGPAEHSLGAGLPSLTSLVGGGSLPLSFGW